MAKKAVSVTLSVENLLWLRSRAATEANRGLSRTLDRLLDKARTQGALSSQARRSVMGMVQVSDEDPGLKKADAAIRGLFSPSNRKRSTKQLLAGERGAQPPSRNRDLVRRRRDMKAFKKTTLLLSRPLHERLTQMARKQGVSLGEIVRKACEAQYGLLSRKERQAAVRELGGLQLPVGPVKKMKRESVPVSRDLLP